MAIQFGIWNLDGKRVDPALVMQACDLLGRYAGVATSVVDQGTLVIILGLNRSDTPSPATTTGPRTNTPHTYWEGRLDNRAEVARRAGVVPGRLTDDEIIERAYEACGNAL